MEDVVAQILVENVLRYLEIVVDNLRVSIVEQQFKVVGIELISLVYLISSYLGMLTEHSQHAVQTEVGFLFQIIFFEVVQDDSPDFLDGVGVLVFLYAFANEALHRQFGDNSS